MSLVFASIVPHPPIILPSIGSEKDKDQVRKTVESLKILGEKIKEAKPDSIIISSPHPDWGFKVPLFFLAENFKGKKEKFLISLDPPRFYFEKGKKIGKKLFSAKKRYALIASGDLSHCLKENGPYGFHPDGPKFDKELIESLEKKEIEKIFNLGEKYSQAGECGLRSFCFALGIIEAYSIGSGQIWQTEVLSYQAPFGVGYLVVNFKLYT